MDLGHSRRAVCTGCVCELIFAVVVVIKTVFGSSLSRKF